ncbi:MAG TPA: hypothetical protein VM260_14245, partial [Pirellula sp.]|nr:hypothetical protein [Pirellula sp.]
VAFNIHCALAASMLARKTIANRFKSWIWNTLLQFGSFEGRVRDKIFRRKFNHPDTADER